MQIFTRSVDGHTGTIIFLDFEKRTVDVLGFDMGRGSPLVDSLIRASIPKLERKFAYKMKSSVVNRKKVLIALYKEEYNAILR